MAVPNGEELEVGDGIDINLIVARPCLSDVHIKGSMEVREHVRGA